MAVWSAAMQAEPRDGDTLHTLGVVAHLCGDADWARQLLGRACRIAPERGEYWRNLGLACETADDAAAAAEAFEAALAIDANDLTARLQLASLWHRRDDLDRGLMHYSKALVVAPALAEIHNQVGVCHLQRGDAVAADDSFRTCLSLAPEHLNAHENSARALLEMRRFAEAESVLSELLAREPGRDEAHVLLGYARLNLGDYAGASDSFLTAPRRRFAPGGAGGSEPADALSVTHTKLCHDLEQLRHLHAKGLSVHQHRRWENEYERALESLPPSRDDAFFFDCPTALSPVFNRLHHDAPAAAVAGGAVTLALDTATIEAAFAARGWTTLDGFLTAQALARLQAFCTEPTIWLEKKFRYEVGASLRNGFCCPLLLQIAEEIRTRFPSVFGRHLFSGCFAYKYYQSAREGHVHADRAAVSLNFWITSDEANLEPERGGLRIWNKRVPAEYFSYSPQAIDRADAALIAAPDAAVEVIPYRCNRAVLFHADQLHASDRMHFREDYPSRRVSVTFLYGKPGDADPI